MDGGLTEFDELFPLLFVGLFDAGIFFREILFGGLGHQNRARKRVHFWNLVEPTCELWIYQR
jgi:hypothetical protein